jgi:serine/threonine protein kinase
VAKALISLDEGNDFAGDYVIERALSRGGMGAVYVALQKSTGRRRALKLMHPQLAGDARAVERFTREAKVGGLIHSDHIVEVLGAGVDEKSGVPWLSMELLEGEDLASRLSRGPMPANEAAVVLKQVAHALGAAHDVGVVHRDLKPENVFLVQTRRVGAEVLVKVLDFGIAKVVAEAGGTNSGFIGTPAYMAPEQCASGTVTPASDVWAFALMAFAMLTGKAFWKAMHLSEGGPIQVLNEVATAAPVLASVRASEYGVSDKLPAGFDAWFAKAATRDAAQRFPEARSAWNALAPVLGMVPEAAPLEDTAPSNPARALNPGKTGERTTPARLESVSAPAPARRVMWLEVACVIGLVAGAYGWWNSRRAPDVAAPVVQPQLVPPPVAQALAAPSPPASPINARQSESQIFDVDVSGSPMWGPTDALVTIVEFADYECPASRSAQPLLEEIRRKYPDDVRLYWKHFPLSFHHMAADASRVSIAAQDEGGAKVFWKAHASLFGAPDLSKPKLLNLAKANGLDPKSVEKAIEAAVAPKELEADVLQGLALGIETTPTFFINGRRVTNVDHAQRIFEEELDRARKLVAGGASRSALYERLTRGGVRMRPRPVRTLPPIPEGIFSDGSRSPDAVMVVQFCDLANWQCIYGERGLKQAIEKHAADVRFTWIPIVDASRPESRLLARSALAPASGVVGDNAPELYKMRAALLAAQTMPDNSAPDDAFYKPAALLKVAAKAGVDLKAYEYGMKGPADVMLKPYLDYGRQLGVDVQRIFIDGDEYTGAEPELGIEAAVARAVERRKAKQAH